MASVFKRCRTIPIPPGATITKSTRAIPKNAKIESGLATWTDRRGVTIGGPVDQAGKRVTLSEATWTDGENTRTATVAPEGDRVIDSIDRNYSGKYRDERGKWQRKSTGTSDRESAKRIASEWESDARLRSEGVINTESERLAAFAVRDITEHADAFVDHLTTKNGTAKYRNRVRTYIDEFIEVGQWDSLRSFEAATVREHAAKLLAGGIASRTVQGRLRAIKGFTKWMTEEHRLGTDPLRGAKAPNPETDRRHERRMMLPDEWYWLRTTVLGQPKRHGCTSMERLLIYRTAIQTGLRVGELAELKRGKLILGSATPHILCKPAGTKNKKPAKQYIDRELADALAEHVALMTGGATVFKMPLFEAAKMLRADLEPARAAWLESIDDGPSRIEADAGDFLRPGNDEGEQLDFHALRHTCGAWLAIAGEHPKTIQTIMRHGTITLTMDRYGHLFPGTEAAAVAKLAAMMKQSPKVIAG